MIRTGPERAPTLILAHGAGAGSHSPFLETISKKLAERDIACIRFEFPYMQKTQSDGKKRPPDRMPKLETSFRNVFTQTEDVPLFIGGKSMGGRVASHLADELNAAGLICLGYPFHPLAKPERTRVAHLKFLQTPTLIVQGERDRFGSKTEIKNYPLSEKIRIAWSPDGDHDLKPRKASGRTHSQNLEDCADEIALFINSRCQVISS
jgi:predicted alpha/beta-hydrolase family hydrolase